MLANVLTGIKATIRVNCTRDFSNAAPLGHQGPWRNGSVHHLENPQGATRRVRLSREAVLASISFAAEVLRADVVYPSPTEVA
jgi:hypothetical protein